MINWAYIAGFTDGEGTIDSRGGYMRIYQKQIDVLYRIQEFLKTHGIESTIATRRARKTNFLVIGSESHLQLNSIEMLKLLPKLLPYLIVKKTVAQDFLRYKRIFPPMSPLRAAKLGREVSTSTYGMGLHDKIARDSETGRWAKRYIEGAWNPSPSAQQRRRNGRTR
jgi:intein/homing endonuclease